MTNEATYTTATDVATTERVDAIQAAIEAHIRRPVAATNMANMELVSRLFRHEQATIADMLAVREPYTALESEVRARSSEAWRQVQHPDIPVWQLHRILGQTVRDIVSIERVTATQNLLWEHRRASVLISVLRHRIATMEAEQEPVRNYDYYGSYPEQPSEPDRRSIADRLRQVLVPKAIPPAHSLPARPRKMILDRSQTT